MLQKLEELKQAWKWNLQDEFQNSAWLTWEKQPVVLFQEGQPLVSGEVNTAVYTYTLDTHTWEIHVILSQPGSPTSPTIFSLEFLTFCGLFGWFCLFACLLAFLMFCICRCNQMLQLLVPLNFWAWWSTLACLSRRWLHSEMLMPI